MQAVSRQRILGRWGQYLGMPVPGPHPVSLACSGRFVDAIAVVELDGAAYLDAPLAALDRVAWWLASASVGEVLDPDWWAGQPGVVEVLGPGLHFWADADTLLPASSAVEGTAADLAELKASVSAEEWEDAGLRSSSIPYVCREDGRIVGAATVSSLFHQWIDLAVLVVPDARRRGIGTQLLARAAAEAIRRSGLACYRASADDEAALALGESLGFTKLGSNLIVRLESSTLDV